MNGAFGLTRIIAQGDTVPVGVLTAVPQAVLSY
jgi:hypothetical protein